ncbi:MAG: hypothetical protein JSR18_13910 [Proteobacteria bacterium]|nr:hypothetical protein [Pseudomonadota bacterium]
MAETRPVFPRPARRRLLQGLVAAPAATWMARARALAGIDYGARGPRAATATDATWHDAARNRDVPVRIRVPAGVSGAPLLLFSHGLGGSIAGGTRWAEHWASHGYVVIHVQHPGSDESLWRGAMDDGPAPSRTGAGRDALVARLRKGMNLQAFLDRVHDIHFVIDEALRQRAAGNVLAAFDGQRIGMSGHSFGAVTTLAICGERYPGGKSFADRRVRAGLAFSPNAGPEAERAARFGSLAMPMLVVTGTRDGDVVGTGASPESRRATFAALPPPDKYLLVLDGAQHLNFNGGALQNRDAAGRHYTAAVDAISLAYWNAVLEGDSQARAWLAQDARSVLAPADVWRYK